MNRVIPGVLLVAALAACAPKGYFLDEQTNRIYVQNRWGRVTKWYEPHTPEYNEIARAFWPYLLEDPEKPAATVEGRRARLSKLIRTLDKDQWKILLDLDLWSGKDKVDLANLEALEDTARAVKGLSFREYLRMKDAQPNAARLKEELFHRKTSEE